MSTTTCGSETADASRARRIADQLADRLADPDDTLRRHPQPRWWRQSLAAGGLGIALLHIERARAGLGPWSRAHAWLRYAASGPVDDGPGSHLHYGAPALAFVLHRAATARPGAGEHALTELDARIARTTHTRLDTAHLRIDDGRVPALAEFDAIRGLTGLGAYWLARDPHRRLVRDIATYLVRLTEPLTAHHPFPSDDELPGWWTPLAPTGRPSPEFPDGHVNNGVAHGIGGPLALLALTATAGVRVPGHDTAIRRICAWYDACHQRDRTGTWWPYWTTPRTRTSHPGRPRGAGPTRRGRPSWCYGTAGLARAHQLAGIALHDPSLRRLGEHALHDVTRHSAARHTLTDASLCHGHAGLLHISQRMDHRGAEPPRPRAAADTDPEHDHRTRPVDSSAAVTERLRRDTLTAAEQQSRSATPALGLLDGLAGVALALTTDAQHINPGWDGCLLIS